MPGRTALVDIRYSPCFLCGGSGHDLNDGKQCRRCKGHGRLCVDCLGRLEHDADPDDQQCGDCTEHERLDRKACGADTERGARRDRSVSP